MNATSCLLRLRRMCVGELGKVFRSSKSFVVARSMDEASRWVPATIFYLIFLQPSK
jgi:hypothetical protein